MIRKNDIYIAICGKYLFQTFSLFKFTVITFQENRCNVGYQNLVEFEALFSIRYKGRERGRGLYTVSGNFTRARNGRGYFHANEIAFFSLSLSTRVVNNAGRTRFRRNRASKLR